MMVHWKDLFSYHLANAIKVLAKAMKPFSRLVRILSHLCRLFSHSKIASKLFAQ